MLQVVKFIEGGFDLTTHQEVPRSVVISNGSREVSLPVSEGQLKDLVKMYAELMGAQSSVEVAPQTRTPAPMSQQVKMFESIEDLPEPEGMVTADMEATGSVLDDGGFEPGEEYSDSGTGVASL